MPQAAGIGLAYKLAKQDNVCVCYFAEGAASEGDFHAAYYRAKAAAFADGSAGTISITKDFGGDVVHP